MFVDRVELNSLYNRKEAVERLLDSEEIGDKTKEVLRDELIVIEDEIETIIHNNILTR